MTEPERGSTVRRSGGQGAPRSLGPRALAWACAAAMAAACAHASPAPAVTQLEERDSGRAIELRPGDRIEVRLAGTPGTGHAWEIAELDRRIVAERGSPGSEPAGPVRPGSPALDTFRFEARAAGTTRLRLVHRRPWERDVAPARSFSVALTVR